MFTSCVFESVVPVRVHLEVFEEIVLLNLEDRRLAAGQDYPLLM